MTPEELRDLAAWWAERSGEHRLQNSDSLRGAADVKRLLAEVNRRSAHTAGLKYKCGCAAVPSEKVKAFCPEHLATLAE